MLQKYIKIIINPNFILKYYYGGRVMSDYDVMPTEPKAGDGGLSFSF